MAVDRALKTLFSALLMYFNAKTYPNLPSSKDILYPPRGHLRSFGSYLTEAGKPAVEGIVKRLFGFAGILILSALTQPCFPSETRVQATGGLSTILTDETTDLSFFMDGNPAGLVLLDTHDRLDAAFQWVQQNSQPVQPGSFQQTTGSIPWLANENDIHYSGLMAFPSPGLAFQAGGDFLSQTGQTGNNFLDSFTASQYRGLLRGAVSLGPLALGLEIRNMESDNAFDQGVYQYGKITGNPYSLQSGSSALNQTFIRAGLLSTFPEKRGPHDAFWQAGGVFEAQVAGGTNILNTSLVFPGGGPFSFQQNNTLSDYYFFGPELRYEVPHQMILRFSYFMIYDDTNFARTVSQTNTDYPNVNSFHSSQYQSMNATGSFRLSFPLSGRENLKIGGFISSFFNNTDDIGTGLNVTDNINRQQVLTNLGVGVEAIHDYTLGIQFSSLNYTLDHSAIAAAVTTISTDFNYFQFTLGGERWLNEHLAYRLGLTAEDDQYFQVSNFQDLLVTLNTGLGWEDTNWACDLRLWVGEQTDLQNSANGGILDGMEISGTVFL